MRDKVAQLVVPRVDGERLGDDEYLAGISALVDEGIGGFILFGGKVPDTTAVIEKLQQRAKVPLLITSDIERGLGQQLQGGTRVPNQWAVAEAIDPGRTEDISLLHSMIEIVREECVSAGINVVFSPVADVNVNPDNPIICTRSFGEEPERVSWFVAEYVKGLQGSSNVPAQTTAGLKGVVACAKHFPGHGDTAVDSHTSLPTITSTRERLGKVELPPFRSAIEAGVGMIMIGHLQVPALEPDPIPATFSRRIVTNLLREEMGFKGVVVTDALDMGALSAICDQGEAAVRSIEAGCDILLHPSDPVRVIDAITEAVNEGRISVERLNESFLRVQGLKERLRSGKPGNIPDQRQPDLLQVMAKKAIRIRKGRGVPLKNPACIIVDDDGDGKIADPFVNAVKGRFRVLEFSEMTGDHTAVVPIFSKVSAWKGSSGLSESSKIKIKKVVEKAGAAILISFGSPYILNHVDADVMIDAFDPADFMQTAVAKVLNELSGD